MTKCYTLDASEESFEVLVVFLDHEIGLPGPCLHTTLEYIIISICTFSSKRHTQVCSCLDKQHLQQV